MGKENKEKVAARQKKYRKKNNLLKKETLPLAYVENKAPLLVAEFNEEFNVNTVMYIDSKFIVNSFLNFFFVKPYLNTTQITRNSQSKRPDPLNIKKRLQIPPNW